MNYQEWEPTVPVAIKADLIWKQSAYRHALFLGELARQDVIRLMQERSTSGVATRLRDAVGSINVKIMEGRSCDSGVERARLYQSALGSACESRYWDQKSCQVLGEAVTEHRMELLEEIICSLLIMIPQQRKGCIQEDLSEVPTADEECLVQNVPMA